MLQEQRRDVMLQAALEMWSMGKREREEAEVRVVNIG